MTKVTIQMPLIQLQIGSTVEFDVEVIHNEPKTKFTCYGIIQDFEIIFDTETWDREYWYLIKTRDNLIWVKAEYIRCYGNNCENN